MFQTTVTATKPARLGRWGEQLPFPTAATGLAVGSLRGYCGGISQARQGLDGSLNATGFLL